MADWHCMVNGQRYGPMPEQELREWIRQQRVRASDLVWQEGTSGWNPASRVPEFAGAFAPLPPVQGGMAPPMPGQGFVQPHRGGAVLTLGILGLVVCFICGIIAWAMGSGDLGKMRAGLMDRSGEGMTRAGMICGMIGTILNAAGLLIWLIWLSSVGRTWGWN